MNLTVHFKNDCLLVVPEVKSGLKTRAINPDLLADMGQRLREALPRLEIEMEILYEIHFTSGKIEKVNVTKTTDKSVWVERGFKHVRREPWLNEYEGFYRTFHEAQKAGRDKLQKGIDALNEQLIRKTAALQRVTNIEEEYVGGPQAFEKIDFSNIKII